MQIVGYFFHSQMIGCLKGSLTGAEYFTNLRIFHVIEILHGKHGALYVGQSCYGLLQPSLCLVTIKVRITH